MSHIWHAQSIFRREDGAIVETKEGLPFSSNHAEAFVDVRLASDYDALRAEVEAAEELFRRLIDAGDIEYDDYRTWREDAEKWCAGNKPASRSEGK